MRSRSSGPSAAARKALGRRGNGSANIATSVEHAVAGKASSRIVKAISTGTSAEQCSVARESSASRDPFHVTRRLTLTTRGEQLVPVLRAEPTLSDPCAPPKVRRRAGTAISTGKTSPSASRLVHRRSERQNADAVARENQGTFAAHEWCRRHSSLTGARDAARGRPSEAGKAVRT
jgi:hypothetical protein